MTDNAPDSDDADQIQAPESTITSGEAMRDPEDAAADDETIHVDLRSQAGGLPNPADAESRREQLEARRELGLLLPEQAAELAALEAGKDPESYSFADYCRDRGVTDEDAIELEREIQRDNAEAEFAAYKEDPAVEVRGDLEGDVEIIL